MHYPGGNAAILEHECIEVKLKYVMNLMSALSPKATWLISSNLKTQSCGNNYFERHFNFLLNGMRT